MLQFLQNTRQQENNSVPISTDFQVLKALASVFYSMHVVDLNKDTAEEYAANDIVRKIVNKKNDASVMMKQVMNAFVPPDHLEAALEFTDLTTIADRMINKNQLSKDFAGYHTGWLRAIFITMEADKKGKPTKVIFATRVIEEEKRQEENLIRITQTDELTGLYNRRAYEEDIYEHNGIPEEDEFIYISLDVNGLKITNDTLGHAAGDELLIGACQCMKKSFGPEGKLYRIGGDEFVAILFTGKKHIVSILKDFDKNLKNWKGILIENISVSYGWVDKHEFPGSSVRKLESIAEKRMYEAKAEHYKKTGLDRRGQQEAHKALCELYTKILKINITDDTYQIVNMDTSEQTQEKGFADKISQWLSSFGKTGQVHPADLEQYLELTDLNYMREYFKNNKTSLNIFYRRKYLNGFKKVMMEIIPASDYKPNNQSLFLYVKNIDK